MPEGTALPIGEGSVVRKKSLKGEVFELLHQRILAGKYLPGDCLRQEEISTCGLLLSRWIDAVLLVTMLIFAQFFR